MTNSKLCIGYYLQLNMSHQIVGNVWLTMQIISYFQWTPCVSHNFRLKKCCIFRPAFGCCTRQTLVKIVIFSVCAAKTLKMTISTSVWGAQHPNAGRNIQQIGNQITDIRKQITLNSGHFVSIIAMPSQSVSRSYIFYFICKSRLHLNNWHTWIQNISPIMSSKLLRLWL